MFLLLLFGGDIDPSGNACEMVESNSAGFWNIPGN